jgi:hypothetical protein
MVKNEVVSFCKVTLFFYDGPDVKKKPQMALWLCSKQHAADGESPRIVKTRTISHEMDVM